MGGQIKSNHGCIGFQWTCACATWCISKEYAIQVFYDIRVVGRTDYQFYNELHSAAKKTLPPVAWGLDPLRVSLLLWLRMRLTSIGVHPLLVNSGLITWPALPSFLIMILQSNTITFWKSSLQFIFISRIQLCWKKMVSAPENWSLCF